MLKIDEDHDKPEHHQQRTQQRFNGGRFLTGVGGGLGATDNSQSSDYETSNGREMHDSLSDDMSLLEELSMYGGDSNEQDEDGSDSKDSSSPKLQPPGLVHPRSVQYHKNQHSGGNGIPRQYAVHQLADKQLKTSTNSLPSTSRNFSLHHKFRNHQNVIDAKRRQFFLPLEQEPFQQQTNRSNMTELPSPSSTSLHSGYSHLILEDLGTKSSSAPLLMKNEEVELGERRVSCLLFKRFLRWNLTNFVVFVSNLQNLRYSRSQSDRHLAGELNFR